MEKESLRLKNDGLGSLRQIADKLVMITEEEICENGISNKTFELEAAYRGIYEIIKLNNIE